MHRKSNTVYSLYFAGPSYKSFTPCVFYLENNGDPGKNESLGGIKGGGIVDCRQKSIEGVLRVKGLSSYAVAELGKRWE